MKNPVPKSPARKYEKGKDRFKHVGKSDKPEIEYVTSNPRHRVGRCPHKMPDTLKTQLLNEAISADNGDREIDFAKRLYVVHEGAIYRAETTDWGISYHAYPYAGKLGRSLLTELGKMAAAKGCHAEFDIWVKDYIEMHGK